METADILINIIFFALQLVLLICCYCLANKYFASIFSKAVITVVLWLIINNFTGAALFSVFIQKFGIVSVVLALFIECIGLFICIKCISKKEIHKYLFWNDTKSITIFSVVAFFLFMFFFLVLTKCTFMPVYGNVDEVVHYECVNAILQKMWINPSKVSYLSATSRNMPYLLQERLSYIWGYHYIVAIISKLFCIDTIYVIHFIRSCMMTLMLSLPLLTLGKAKHKIFAYIFYFAVVIGTIPLWFLFLTSGFTAQMYSIVFIEFAIILFSELEIFSERTGIAINILCASLIWATLNAYILTGAILLSYYVINCLLNKRWKNLLGAFISTIPIMIYPSMRTQISAFLKGEKSDEALTAQYFGVKYLNWYIILLFIFIAVLYVIIKKCVSKEKMIGISAVVAVILSVLWVSGNREGYIIYKCFFSMYLLVIVDFIILVDLLSDKINRSYIRKVITGLVGIFTIIYLIYGCGIISYKNIRNAFDTEEPMLTEKLYDCVKFVEKDDSLLEGEFDGIGVYGPQLWCSEYVYLGKLPISSWGTPERNAIIFTDYNAASLNRVLDGLTVMFEQKQQVEFIVLIVDKIHAVYNRSLLYNHIVKTEQDVYENERYVIKKLEITPVSESIHYDINAFEQSENEGFIISDIMYYGKCIIPKQINTEYKLNIDLQAMNHVDVLEISGRSIHNSEMKCIITDMDEKIYTIDIASFENLTEVDLSEYDIKELQLSVTANVCEDGIIINEISLYNCEE